jgi:hypothetical protein
LHGGEENHEGGTDRTARAKKITPPDGSAIPGKGTFRKVGKSMWILELFAIWRLHVSKDKIENFM